MIVIGERIHKLLKEKGYTVKQLADYLGIDRCNAYRIFKSESIDTRQLISISKFLNHNFLEELSKEIDVSK